MKRSFAVTFFTLINVVIFILWISPMGPAAEPGFMNENFLVSWDALMEGRYWVLISSVFSHNLFWHIFLNMYVLTSFGPIVERVLGTWRFFVFYILAGIISSLSHAAVSAFLIGNPAIPALGASGSVSGVILLFSLIFPKEKILLFGIIPLPAIMGALLFVGLDVWGLVEQAGGGGLPIGHGAHLGGAITGIIYYFWRIRGNLIIRDGQE